MDEVKASYKLSVKESAGVTKIAVTDFVVLSKLLIVFVFLIRGHNALIEIPGVEFKFRPVYAFLFLHVVHFVLGLWALAIGSQAASRMAAYRDSQELRVFRDAGTILASTHLVYGWWRMLTCFAPVFLTAVISQNNVIACSASFIAAFPWMTLWADTVNFRQPDVVPVTIFSYIKMPFQVVYYAAWIPCVILKRICTGDRSPI